MRCNPTGQHQRDDSLSRLSALIISQRGSGGSLCAPANYLAKCPIDRYLLSSPGQQRSHSRARGPRLIGWPRRHSHQLGRGLSSSFLIEQLRGTSVINGSLSAGRPRQMGGRGGAAEPLGPSSPGGCCSLRPASAGQIEALAPSEWVLALAWRLSEKWPARGGRRANAKRQPARRTSGRNAPGMRGPTGSAETLDA